MQISRCQETARHRSDRPSRHLQIQMSQQSGENFTRLQASTFYCYWEKNRTKQPFIQQVLKSLYKHLDGNFKEFLGLFSSLIDTFVLYHELISWNPVVLFHIKQRRHPYDALLSPLFLCLFVCFDWLRVTERLIFYLVSVMSHRYIYIRRKNNFPLGR